MKAVLLAFLSTIVAGNVLQTAPTLVGWQVVGRTDATKRVTVRLTLKKDQRAVERKLWAAATPGSPTFREWASKEELDSMLRIASADPVVKHLNNAGISTTVIRDSVVAEMTVAQVESIFRTTVSDYKNAEGMVWHSADSLHAPAEVTANIEAVFGLHGFPLPLKKTVRQPSSIRGSMEVGPEQLRSVYGVPSGTRGSGRAGAPRQAVAEFQGQWQDTNDLVKFFKELVPYAQAGDDQIYAFKGNNGTGFGVEALLDIQYIMGVGVGIKTEFWGWRSQDFCSDLKNWTQTILSDSDPPVVFSISYGWQGDLKQIGCQSTLVDSIDSDLQQLAARGISIIFASGDSGSGETGKVLWPSWPASSNWVTAVGATAFTDDTMKEQKASTQFGSGSGFSSMFPQTPFQRGPVAAYLSGQGSNLPPDSYYNKTGRATADVSALGEGFKVMVHGKIEAVGGTSASTPTFSGLVSLLNDALFVAGKSRLGYLNPWIYNSTSGFTDITIGSDKISRGGTPYRYGFDCAKGWDPATGVGTPIFNKL